MKKYKKNCKYCNKRFDTNHPNNIYCSKQCREIDYEFMGKQSKFQAVRFEVLARDNFKCFYCGRNPKEHGIVLHVDHIRPKSRGGKDIYENLVSSCADCNQSKANKEFSEELYKELLYRLLQ